MSSQQKNLVYALGQEVHKLVYVFWTRKPVVWKCVCFLTGNEMAQLLGHRAVTLIQSCSLFTTDGAMKYLIPCEDRVKVTQITNPVNYNCYLFSVKESHQSFAGIDLVLYLNNLQGMDSFMGLPSSYHYNRYSTTGQTIGALFSIVEPGTLPTQEQKRLNPGTLNEIEFSIVNNSFLTPPHGNCNSHVTDIIYQINDKEYRYTEDVCLINCIAHKVLNRCSCIPVVNGHLMLESNGTLPYCASIKHRTIDEVIANMNCSNSISVEVRKLCQASCKPKCEKTSYPSQMKTTTWPLIQVQESFYKQMVVNKPYQFRFEEIYYELVEAYAGKEPEDIFGEMYEKHIAHPQFELLRELEEMNNKHHEEHYVEEINEKHHSNETNLDHDITFAIAGARSEMITNNFLRISAYMAKSTVTVKEDSMKYTPMSLLSQIGAIANLWAGITIVVVIEMVELLYRMSTARKQDVTKTKVQEFKT